jgi:hypothetical protein
MNPTLEYESRRAPDLREKEQKTPYGIAAIGLILLWAVFAVMTFGLAVALFVPGHLGLSDWLRVLGDSPMFST